MGKLKKDSEPAGLLERTLLGGMKLKAPEVKNKYLQCGLDTGAFLGRWGSKVLTFYLEGGNNNFRRTFHRSL